MRGTLNRRNNWRTLCGTRIGDIRLACISVPSYFSFVIFPCIYFSTWNFIGRFNSGLEKGSFIPGSSDSHIIFYNF